MSSLRVETLRLCWIEAFLAVHAEMSISGAARALAINQSMVSRYMRELEIWLGKTLIEIDRGKGSKNPRTSLLMTEEGQQFTEIAQCVLNTLNKFRAPGVDKLELIDELKYIIEKIRIDYDNKVITTDADVWSLGIQIWEIKINRMSSRTKIGDLIKDRTDLRDFNSEFEKVKKAQRRRLKLHSTTPPPDIPSEWFNKQREAGKV